MRVGVLLQRCCGQHMRSVPVQQPGPDVRHVHGHLRELQLRLHRTALQFVRERISVRHHTVPLLLYVARRFPAVRQADRAGAGAGRNRADVLLENSAVSFGYVTSLAYQPLSDRVDLTFALLVLQGAINFSIVSVLGAGNVVALVSQQPLTENSDSYVYAFSSNSYSTSGMIYVNVNQTSSTGLIYEALMSDSLAPINFIQFFVTFFASFFTLLLAAYVIWKVRMAEHALLAARRG